MKNLERRRGEGVLLRTMVRAKQRGNKSITIGVRKARGKAFALEPIKLDLGQNAWRETYLPGINLDVTRMVSTRSDMLDDIAKDYKEFKMRIRTALKIRFASGPTLVREPCPQHGGSSSKDIELRCAVTACTAVDVDVYRSTGTTHERFSTVLEITTFARHSPEATVFGSQTRLVMVMVIPV
jgi:hypothetical protein